MSLPWRQNTPPHSESGHRARFFLSSHLKKKLKKKKKTGLIMSSRDLSLLRRALRYERDTGEVSCSLVYDLACTPPPPKKNNNNTKQNFLKKFHRRILSHWDKLPLELRQTIQWMADQQQAHDRLKRGWEKYTVKPSRTFANFVRFGCNQGTTQCAIHFLRNIVNNVMFVLIVSYITTVHRPSPTIIVRGTKHISATV